MQQRLFLLVPLIAASFLTACSGATHRTFYSAPISTEVSTGWRVVDVAVAVPENLSISEDRVLVPDADIVWREDPEGDRKQQVAAIVKRGIELGAKDLRGSRSVRIDATVRRFHAMTLEAETVNANVGVHNIDLVLRAIDVRSGEVLSGPTDVQADFPALTGPRMIAARVRGESQKSQIIQHLQSVVRGWLGIGPDPRRSFTRLGG
jgi:hypothetical protein